MWNLKKYKNNIAMITDDGITYTYHQLDQLQQEFAAKVQHRKLGFIICTNAVACVVAYVSCITNKIPIMLVSENIIDEKLEELIDKYKPEWIYKPQGNGTYELVRKDVNEEYVIHNVGIHANNMFAYCENSPIISANSGGEASSTVVGLEGEYNYVALWSSDMKKYNCYSYAINYTARTMDPGSISEENDSPCSSLNSYVTATINDLHELGYKYVYEIQRSQINSYSGTVIALRLDTQGDQKDYHWMKYTKSANAWLHKPGETAILRFKTQENVSSWKGESYNGETGKWSINNSLTYTGEIKYIVYK